MASDGPSGGGLTDADDRAGDLHGAGVLEGLADAIDAIDARSRLREATFSLVDAGRDLYGDWGGGLEVVPLEVDEATELELREVGRPAGRPATVIGP